MTDNNARTLASYGAHVPDYVAGTTHEVMGAAKDWIDRALADVPSGAAILELGSAFGRDACYIRDRGYEVECTDAVPGFLDHLRTLGFAPRSFNLLTDRLSARYDLILANAVLLHFDRAQFARIITDLAQALNGGGRLAFSLKQGEGEEWSEAKLGAPRYFCYWQPDALPPLLAAAGFADWTIEAATSERTHADWLYGIARV